MDASKRGRLLNKLADFIERDREYLAVSFSDIRGNSRVVKMFYNNAH